MTANGRLIFSWILKLTAAIIMLQTLYFKFTGSEESVYIFSRMEIEPWGRIVTGVMELIASLLILYPATTSIGALLALGIMSGALGSHLLVLGISVKNDGGQLFIYAFLVWISSALLLYIHRRQLAAFIPFGLLPSR